MKTLILAVVAFVTITSASAQEQFTLRGVVKDPAARGQQINLMNTDEGKVLDSTKVSDKGTFVFKGNVAKPKLLTVKLPNLYTTYFVAERGIIDMIMGNVDTVSGTQLNNVYQRYNNELIAPKIAIELSMQSYGRNMTREIYDSIMQKHYFPMLMNIPNAARKLLVGNENNVVGGLILEHWLSYSGVDNSTFDSLTTVAGPVALENAFVQKEIVRRQAEAATSEGKQFADFEGTDTLGNKIRLSDFAGKDKWVLLDFWSSGCGPCRQAMPTLAKLQEELRDCNFMVVGVNVWEREMSHAQYAIRKLGITWPTIVVKGQGPENKATQAYGVRGIPRMLLIDPSGKIVARDFNLDLAQIKQRITKNN